MCLVDKKGFVRADIVTKKGANEYICSYGRCGEWRCKLSTTTYSNCTASLTTKGGYLLLKLDCGNRERYYLVPEKYVTKPILSYVFSSIPRIIQVKWILRNPSLLYLEKESGLVVYKRKGLSPHIPTPSPTEFHIMPVLPSKKSAPQPQVKAQATTPTKEEGAVKIPTPLLLTGGLLLVLFLSKR